jgi:6-phosphogluconolactonase
VGRALFHIRMKLSLLFVMAVGLVGTCLQAASDQMVYVGTYTNGKNPRVESKGIYAIGFDSKTGKLESPVLAGEATNPSFVAIAPSKKFLYAVSEASGGGVVSSFSRDAKTGKLTLLNQQSSQGKGPCHVSVDHTGKTVMVANYGSGHVASYPVKDDGSLGEAASSYLQGPASNVNPGRQKDPHAHSINVDAGNKFAFACDLGCDKVFIYKLDAAAGKLTPNDPAFAEVPAGAGPRHFAFHPNGKFAYVNNEMAMSVTAFAYDAAKGALTAVETISTLPPGTEPSGKYSTAETQVHPSGKFAYVSNRGHDTIACYKVDEATGKLTFIEAAPSIVQTPRNFGIDPTGHWMITAGQNSSTIAVLAIDQATGKLTPTGQTLDVGAPVCVKFVTQE